MRKVVAMLLIICFSTLSWADSKNEVFQKELIQFFDEYLQDYNNFLSGNNQSESIKASTFHFNMPLMQMPKSGYPRVPKSREILGKGLAAFLNRLKTQGVERIIWKKLEIKALTDNKAIATNTAVGLKANGSVHNHMASIYMLYKGDKGWKIALISPYSPENALRFE